MQILPVHTPVIRKGDDLAEILRAHAEIRDGDILVVSSKAAATAEGAEYDLRTLTASEEAKTLGKQWQTDPLFCEATFIEAKRMHGKVVSAAPGVLLCEVRPDNFPAGTLLAAYAGLDRSNVVEGFTIGWPRDVVRTVTALRASLGCPIILSDSCCAIRRNGVTAYALAVAGIDPLRNEIGKPDLFGRTLRMTQEAIADQLAVAGNIVMGNAAQSIPAAIIRDHGIASSDFVGWVPGIEPEKDLFRDLAKV